MKKMLFLQLALCAISTSCAAQQTQVPYTNGRLVRPAYIELAGDEHQISDIKKYARQQGWSIDCEARVGQQSTLRLKFKSGTKQKTIEDYFAGDLQHPRSAKSNMIYYPMHRSSGCIILP